MTKKLQQLKTVAEYDGWMIEPGMEKERNPFYNKPFKQGFTPQMFLLSNLPFRTSWNAQIPVWSKALKEAKAMQKEWRKSEIYFSVAVSVDTLELRYHNSINTNSPTDGFEVLVELIQFINKHKEK